MGIAESPAGSGRPGPPGRPEQVGTAGPRPAIAKLRTDRSAPDGKNAVEPASGATVPVPARAGALSSEGRSCSMPMIFGGLSTALLLVFVLVVTTQLGGRPVVKVVDDLCQLLAAAAATIGTGLAARASMGRIRLAWSFTSAGALAWCIGQTIFSCYDLLAGELPPNPSVADPFFLLFPTGAAAGLAMYAWAGTRAQRLRNLLDGLIAGAALFAIGWSTSIGAQIKATDVSTFGRVVLLAYPAGDVVVLTVVVLALGRSTTRTPALWLIAAGMAALALSDSVFTYLSATDGYSTGTLLDGGWVAGYLLLGLAGAADVERQQRRRRNARPAGPLRAPASPTVGRMAAPATMLPYIPLLVAAAVVAVRRFGTGSADDVANGALVVSMAAVLARQYVTLRDNRSLVHAVAAREELLQRQAFSDQLTGLANRALFTDRAAHALALHEQNLRPLALLFVDLDDFKAVNDTLGHAAGDQLLIRVAERILGALRSGDTLARFGGDEFAVLVEDGEDAVALGARMVESLRVPFALGHGSLLGNGQLGMRASIGVTEVGAHDATPTLDELFSRADIAMYAAKRAGKSQVALYVPTMVLPEAADLELRPALARALADGAIDVVFQPIVHLATGRIRSVEALARWVYQGEPVHQGYFIELAGRSGLMPELTDHMLRQACRQLRDWSDRLGLTELQASVNVPPGQISDPDFPDRVAAVLEEFRIRPDRLFLEITEDALLGDVRAARAVAARLGEIGVGLSLDDFGTGYSSLLSLRQIPLQSVKIDIAFVATVDRDPDAERFLGALLALGRDLQLTITAEGIERPQQAAILRALGCQFAQGFLFSRPLPAADLEPFLLGKSSPGWSAVPSASVITPH